MLKYTVCAFLAPVLVSCGLFPTPISRPNGRAPPAPTPPPSNPNIPRFKRAEADSTCGYISGNPQNSLTCTSENFLCATNTLYGVQGCCDASAWSDCVLPTYCVPSTALPSCSAEADCAENSMVTRCSNAEQPSCFELHYVYDTTTMTEHGCAASAYTITAQRSLPKSSNPSATELKVSVVTVTARPSASDLNAATGKGGSSTPIGAIVGGVVGGLAVIIGVGTAITCIIVKDRRKKKIARNEHVDYAASAAPSAFASPPSANKGFQTPHAGNMEYAPHPEPDGVYIDNDGVVKTWPVGCANGARHNDYGAGIGDYPLVVESGGRMVERGVHEAP